MVPFFIYKSGKAKGAGKRPQEERKETGLHVVSTSSSRIQKIVVSQTPYP